MNAYDLLLLSLIFYFTFTFMIYWDYRKWNNCVKTSVRIYMTVALWASSFPLQCSWSVLIWEYMLRLLSPWWLVAENFLYLESNGRWIRRSSFKVHSPRPLSTQTYRLDGQIQRHVLLNSETYSLKIRGLEL